MERYGCESVRVRAAKPEPPLPLAIQEVAVEVVQERAESDEDEAKRPRARPVRTGYLGLGSNVGDRELSPAGGDRAARASGASRSRRSPRPTRPSRSARSSTSPTSSTPRSAIRTELEPEELLDLCKEIEAERGRALDAPRHSPRPLDVDLLLLGDLELSTDRLTLPAPAR